MVLGNVSGAGHDKCTRVGRTEEREDLMIYWIGRGNEKDGESIGYLSDF